jgi:hypothetical protein
MSHREAVARAEPFSTQKHDKKTAAAFRGECDRSNDQKQRYCQLALAVRVSNAGRASCIGAADPELEATNSA